MLFRALIAVVLFASSTASAQVGGGGSKADYERAAALPELARGKVLNTSIRPEWLSPTTFWYRTNGGEGRRRYWLVDAEATRKTPLFDHASLAAAYGAASGKPSDADRLPIERIERAAGDDSSGALLLMMRDDPRIWRLSAEGSLAEQPVTERTPFHLAPHKTQRSSRSSTTEAPITFVNNTSESVKMFWIDTTGNRHPYDRLAPGATATQHTFSGHAWVAVGHDGRDLAFFVAASRPSIALIEERAPAGRKPPQNDAEGTIERAASAVVDLRFAIKDHNVVTVDPATGVESALSTDGTAENPYDGRFIPSPDGTRLVAMRTTRGGDRKVVYIESSPSDQVQPKVHDYAYLKPGDEIPLSRPMLFDLKSRAMIPVSNALFQTPWSIDRVEWAGDSSRFMFLYNQRGHTVMRLIGVDAASGEARTIINEEPKTFFDYAAKTHLTRLEKTRE